MTPHPAAGCARASTWCVRGSDGLGRGIRRSERHPFRWDAADLSSTRGVRRGRWHRGVGHRSGALNPHRNSIAGAAGPALVELALMRPRWLFVLAASALVLGAVVAGLAVMTAAALPLALVLGATVLALVAGVGTRLRHRAGWRRGQQAPSRSNVGRDDRGTGERSDGPRGEPRLRWSTRWESNPPVHAVPHTRERVAAVLAEWGLTGEPVEPTLLVVTEFVERDRSRPRSGAGRPSSCPPRRCTSRSATPRPTHRSCNRPTPRGPAVAGCISSKHCRCTGAGPPIHRVRSCGPMCRPNGRPDRLRSPLTGDRAGLPVAQAHAGDAPTLKATDHERRHESRRAAAPPVHGELAPIARVRGAPGWRSGHRHRPRRRPLSAGTDRQPPHRAGTGPRRRHPAGRRRRGPDRRRTA